MADNDGKLGLGANAGRVCAGLTRECTCSGAVIVLGPAKIGDLGESGDGGGESGGIAAGVGPVSGGKGDEDKE